jgi:16S rRNA (cytosine1402-N4)-methyltransferase
MTTPASTHASVLLAEAIDALAIAPDGAYVDATFGRGGHSRAILARLGTRGRLVALDRDPEAVAAARSITDPRFAIVHADFGHLADACSALGLHRAQGVLFDLGVSSPQLDDPRRGFSFRADGPLDMRMDPTQGVSAADWLAAATEERITEVLREYGEERFARQIAKAIAAARLDTPIRTTGQLAGIVGRAVRTREPGQDPATRTFQALRIHVNEELAQLPVALEQAVALLAPAGRLAVISFHSLEDRIVKHFMREAAHPEAKFARLPVRDADLPRPRLRTIGKPVRPRAAEIAANPRARSAILRVAEKPEEADSA